MASCNRKTTQIVFHTLVPSLSLSLSHTNTHTYAGKHTHTHTCVCSHPISQLPDINHSHRGSPISLSLSLTHTHTHTQRHACMHAHAHIDVHSHPIFHLPYIDHLHRRCPTSPPPFSHTHTPCISFSFSLLPCINQSHVQGTHKDVSLGHLQLQHAYCMRMRRLKSFSFLFFFWGGGYH